jgi:large subunit ribosomal protein L23
MKLLETVLIKPVLTEKIQNFSDEKATHAKKAPKYGFMVRLDSSKKDIKIAVEKRFNVNVEAVHVINVKGKTKRMSTRRGMTTGRRSDMKKAIVTLKKEQKIDFFAGK